MKTVFCLLVVVALSCAADSGKLIEKAFADHKVVPDVVQHAPEKPLKIVYKKSHKMVNFGNELAPKDVRETPEVEYHPEDASAFYTLAMVDPDAPSRKTPTAREWQHWLVVNIPGADLAKGETKAEYVGSGPPKDTGLHRYVVLLFKQPKKLDFDEPHHTNKDGNRAGFDVSKFAEKYHLGNPVAGNFFQAKFDDSVPELHKQLQG